MYVAGDFASEFCRHNDALLVAAGAPGLKAVKPVMPMVLIGSVLVVTFVFMAFDWLHKTIAALLGAIVAVCAGAGARCLWRR